jgi:hypothetical protein
MPAESPTPTPAPPSKVAPWPRLPQPFASTYGSHAHIAALYCSAWTAPPSPWEHAYFSVDDVHTIHRAGVRWEQPVGLLGVKVRFAPDHVPRGVRLGVRRRGAETIEWAGLLGAAPGEEVVVSLPGPAVAVVVEQSVGGGSWQNPGVLGIACLTPDLARKPSMELLLEHPGGLHRPALPVAVDGSARTGADAQGATAILLHCTPARGVRALGFEIARLGVAGSPAVLGPWLASVTTIELDGTPVPVVRRGLDGSTSGVVAGSTRVVFRLARTIIARQIRVALPGGEAGASAFLIRRVTLDPRPVAYPRHLPTGAPGLHPALTRPVLSLGVPYTDVWFAVAPDGMLRLPVPGRAAHQTVVGMGIDGVPFPARERGRDARTGILVDRAEVGGLRILRSVIPAAGRVPGIELRLVIQNQTDASRTAVLRIGRVRTEGLRQVSPEEVMAIPLQLPPRGEARESVWIPMDPDEPARRGRRPGDDPERESVRRTAELLAGSVSFRLPDRWDGLVRRLLVSAVNRVGEDVSPLLQPGAPRGSLALGRWAEGLAVWGAGQVALDAFHADFRGARRTGPPLTEPAGVHSHSWSPLLLLQWAGLGPEHAARVAARIGGRSIGGLRGPAAEMDTFMAALWAGDRAGFLAGVTALEALLDREVMVHRDPGDPARAWTPIDDLAPVVPPDPQPSLLAMGVHLSMLRHAMLTEPPDRAGSRRTTLRLFSGLPADVWGHPTRMMDAPTLMGPVSLSMDPTEDGRVKVKIKAPGAERIELVPPLGEPILLPGGSHSVVVG